jgi:hypothetical protein
VSLLLALAAALAPQADPAAAERGRIRGRPPLSAEERALYAAPAAPPPRPRASALTLAVIPLSWTDLPFGTADPGELFFVRAAAYFARVSGGRFALRGRAYPPVALPAPRARFGTRDLEAALGALAERRPDPFDAAAFVAAGGLGERGGPLWPRTGTLGGTPYLLVTESMNGLETGIVAHETMHLLGFEDKYDDDKARAGDACILGTGYRRPEPAPPCLECRLRLGWASAAEIDPRRPGKFVLAPDPSLGVRVPLNADGTEALLLEAREEGLYAWHVGGGRKIELLGRYPSETSDRLTPLSDPPLRGRTAGAWTVWITDIRLEEGRTWFRIGPEGTPTPLEERRREAVGRRLGD